MGGVISIRGVIFLVVALWCGNKALRRPIYGAAFMTVLILLRDPYLRVVYPMAYEQLHLPLIFGMVSLFSVFMLNRESIQRIGFQGEVRWLFAYIFIIFFSAYLGGADDETPAEALKSALLFLIVLYSVRDRDDLFFISKVILGAVFFLFLNVYFDYRVKGMDISNDRYYFMNRNSLGALFACMLPMALAMMWFARNKLQRYFQLGMGGGMALGTILTYSRASFLAMVSGVVTLIALNRKHRKELIVVCAIAVAVLSVRVSDKFLNRIDTIYDYRQEGSAMGRVAMNKAALGMFRDHWMFGVGAGNFRDLSYSYTPEDMVLWVREGKQIHNIMLQVLSENGIVGGIAFCAMIWVVLRKAYAAIRLRRHSESNLYYLHQALFAATVCYLVAAQFGQGAYYGLLYFLLPLLAASSYLNSEPEPEPAPQPVACEEHDHESRHP